MSQRLDIGLGWHYLLDLSWAAKQLQPSPGMLMMDAGAGYGLMQWWLAEQGIDVLSVDQKDRRDPPERLRDRYAIERWANRVYGNGKRNKIESRIEGTVFFHTAALSDLKAVPNRSVDAVVSISALEHNDLDTFRLCLGELLRTLKPGGKLVVTLGASNDRDWFHECSRGWCYTETTLRDVFDLPPHCPSNYDRYDALYDALRDCAELRDNLAEFYFKSGDNGMPWGVWDPKYQPVGVVKVKGPE
jgi:ubiquinone/menaquinone biosynthesis C-methylase UbiE